MNFDAKKEFERIAKLIGIKKKQISKWVGLWYKRYNQLDDNKKELFWILLDEKYKGYEVWRALLELGV
jgi:transposase-like protein